MKQFLPEELIQFLQKTDEFLSTDCELIVIGGAAASLAYGAIRTTTDIDLATVPPEHFLTALKLASKETGLSIPVSYVGLHEPPYAYEDRLTVLRNPAFNKLHLYMPERHDLALMKMVRGYENDIQVIEEIHQNHPFKLEIFVERFMDEMTQVSGNPTYIRLNFLLVVETLFSAERVEEAKRITAKWTALYAQDEAD